MRLFLKVCWRQRSKEVQTVYHGGDLVLPEGVMIRGTIRVLENVCVFPNEYLMNIFLKSLVVSRMAGQVRNAWSLLPVLYESASVWKLERNTV